MTTPDRTISRRQFAKGLGLAAVTTAVPVVRGPKASKVSVMSVRAARGTLQAPGSFGLVGVAWEPGTDPPDGVEIRTSVDGKRWSDWFELHIGAVFGCTQRQLDPA